MPNSPILHTPRLILRPPIEADLDGWEQLMGAEESARFIGGVQSRATAWRFMAAVAGSWSLKGYSMFSVVEQATGQWIGRVGPWYPEGWPSPEVGWGLLRSTWGKGYAAEAGAAAIDWVFDNLDWPEVTHAIDPDNSRSKAVAARLGSRYLRQAVLPPPLGTPAELWGQSREDWLAKGKRQL